jgi:hypothetical protein
MVGFPCSAFDSHFVNGFFDKSNVIRLVMLVNARGIEVS